MRNMQCRTYRARRFCIQDISAPGHRFDQAVILIAELGAQFPNALHQGVVRNRHVSPHRIEQLLFGNKTPDVSSKVAEHFERLGPKRNVLSTHANTASAKIESEAVEISNTADELVHSDTPSEHGNSANDRKFVSEKSSF